MNHDVPLPDDVTEEWWAATRDHRYLLQTCSACQHVQHPPRAVCTACGTTEGLTLEPASGRGAVDSWTVVHRAPRPGVETPYTIARIRLSEGPIVLTSLADQPGAPEPSIGTPVVLAWVDLADGRALPVFTTATGEA
jgi:uncharacterized OB-fold protein